MYLEHVKQRIITGPKPGPYLLYNARLRATLKLCAPVIAAVMPNRGQGF